MEGCHYDRKAPLPGCSCLPAVPVFRDNYIANRRIRRHTVVELGAPAAFFEHLVCLEAFESGIHHVPALHGVSVGLLVQTVEDGNFFIASNLQQLVQVCNGVGLVEAIADHVVELAVLVQEVVVRIDEDDCDVFGGHLGFGGHAEIDQSDCEIQEVSIVSQFERSDERGEL